MITNEIVCAYCGDGFYTDELLQTHYYKVHQSHINSIANREEIRLNKKIGI